MTIDEVTQGVVKLDRVRVICPACRQEVEAVASDGRVQGFCAVAREHVDCLIDAPVQDYLRGDRAKVILNRYGIGSGKLYRALRRAGVVLRMSPESNA